MSERTVRINELIRREISDILRRNYQSEAVALTVTEVRVAPDLRDGRVFVSVVGGEEEAEQKLQWLRRQAPAIREEVGRRVVLKFLPRFDYILDNSASRASRVMHILDEIDQAEKNRPAAVLKAMEKFYPQFAADFERLWSRLPARVAVVGHARPDGDCIGAQIALARVLRATGRETICVNGDPVPRRLRFLAGEEKFLRADDLLKQAEKWPAVFVDCADHARIGSRLQSAIPAALGNIDHHLSNAGYAEVNIVDSASAATCELLAGLFFDRGLPVDAPTAQGLYTGILTDTGQFRFNSTTRRCFVLAGELVARGAAPALAGFELYERESLAKLQLLQNFLHTLRLEFGGRVCLGTLSDGVYAATGATAEDTEGLVDYARSIEGVDIGVLVEHRPNGGMKASLRAKDPAFRVDLIAAQFHGGGHASAAGLNLSPAPADFTERLLAAIGRRLTAVDAGKKSAPKT